MKYVALDIGCLECGEASAVLGIFCKQEPAQEACDKARELQRDNWSGQHCFVVMPVPLEDVEYIPDYSKSVWEEDE